MDALNGLMNLQYLDISFNKLRNIERSNIGVLPNLKIFICDSNYLKNINSFSKLENLTYISFENNKISDISNIEKLAELETIKEINLINNPLTKLVNYRVNMIRKFYYVMKIDGVEVSNEEREIAIMDQTLHPNIPNMDQMNNNNIYLTKMENTKVKDKKNLKKQKLKIILIKILI
jgi:Leucine-rich repeat (LRR) protein